MIKTNKLDSYFNLFDEYTELRIQENRSLYIAIVNGDIMSNSKSATSGSSARVHKDGFWGFSSNPEIDESNIKNIIKHATKNAVFLASKNVDMHDHAHQQGFPKTIHNSNNDFTTKKTKKTQEELIEFLKSIDEHIAKNYSDLASRAVILSTLDMEKSLITSDKSISYSMLPRSLVIVTMTLIKNNEPTELYSLYGGFGQFEDNFSDSSLLFSGIEKQYKNLVEKSEGIYAKAGIKDCILDADLAGILAHEAIGHTVEADLVLGGSVAANYMDKKVASELITLVDFANHYNNMIAPVPIFTDDEGTEAKDTVIIDKGILKSYMHNKESSVILNSKPTGNARAYQFSDEPLIRMRNTAILPGTSKLEDMIASIDDGYYLIKPSNGQADSTSEFMFGVTLGYEIKNGKLGRAIKDTTISGIAFDVLKSVTMVSDDMIWTNGGMCGKKQLITVGMGGPAIKCKVNIGGK